MKSYIFFIMTVISTAYAQKFWVTDTIGYNKHRTLFVISESNYYRTIKSETHFSDVINISDSLIAFKYNDAYVENKELSSFDTYLQVHLQITKIKIDKNKIHKTKFKNIEIFNETNKKSPFKYLPYDIDISDINIYPETNEIQCIIWGGYSASKFKLHLNAYWRLWDWGYDFPFVIDLRLNPKDFSVNKFEVSQYHTWFWRKGRDSSLEPVGFLERKKSDNFTMLAYNSYYKSINLLTLGRDGENISEVSVMENVAKEPAEINLHEFWPDKFYCILLPPSSDVFLSNLPKSYYKEGGLDLLNLKKEGLEFFNLNNCLPGGFTIYDYCYNGKDAFILGSHYGEIKLISFLCNNRGWGKRHISKVATKKIRKNDLLLVPEKTGQVTIIERSSGNLWLPVEKVSE